MTLKHSPGPWSVHTDAYGWKDIHDADERFVTGMPRGSDEMVANGCLIAAAPEMLRLLRVLCDGLDEYWESQNMAVVVEARELIARLDGDT